jgi:acylphosphatase
MTICRRVLFAGRVQGVGFRYTALHLAEGFAIAGTVRNLRDGRVELAAEGEAEEVDRYLNALRRHMASYIDEESVQDEAPQGAVEFRIAY